MKKYFIPFVLSATMAFGAGMYKISPLNIPTLNAYAENVTITNGLTLTQDTVYENDLILKNGTLNLNGYKLTVKGNLIQGSFLGDNDTNVVLNEGELNVNGNYSHFTGSLNVNGTLKINGNYRQDSVGRGENSSGTLTMNNSYSLLDIDGDAVFWSAQTADYQNSGILRIGGNLTVTDSGSCFQAWNSHVTEFKGDTTHTINFYGSEVNYLNFVRVTDGGKLLLSGNTTGFTLDSDVTFANESTLRGNRTLNLNGHALTVDGDFYQGGFLIDNESPDVNITADSTMNVTGDYRHFDGILNVAGNLHVNGSYCQNRQGRGEATDGILYMNNENCLFDVDNDAVFWSAQTADYQNSGILRIGGNLTVTDSGNCFQSWNSHVTEFKGDTTHTINFYSSAVNYLNFVRVTDSGKLLLSGNTTGFTLDSNVTFANESTLRGNRTLNLNGHILTVDGDFYQGGFLIGDESPDVNITADSTMNVTGDYRHFDGILNVAGNLHVNGGYYQNRQGRGEATDGILYMNNENCLFDIDNDAVFWSAQTADYQNSGVLRIGGNLTVTDGGNCFQSWNTHVTEFKGDTIHTINFYSSEVNYLNFVRVTDGGKLLLSGNTTGFTLDSDVTFANESTLRGNRTLNLNGHALTVDGDFYQGGFLIENESPDVNITADSTMNVTGDYRHFDGILNVAGNLHVNGGYCQNRQGRGEATDGILYMNYENCLLDIDGDAVFWSAQTADYQNSGVLRIGGNLTVTNSGNCFQPWNSHVTEFKGNTEHIIDFANQNGYFNIIKMGIGDSLKFTGNLSGIEKNSSAKIKVTPSEIASVSDLTITGTSKGEGTVVFSNDDFSATKTLIISESSETSPQPSANLMGDVNNDGSFSIADVVMLQKWLTASPDSNLANWKNGDFTNDNRIDIFDFCIMKRELLKHYSESEIIATNFNIYTVQNKPQYETTFTLEKDCEVYSIMTYHWNNAQGNAKTGTIGLLEDGVSIGTWNTSGSEGMYGVKNANWWAYPLNLTLKAGHTYTVVDSEPDTWSCNGGSDYKGFFEVKGKYIQ